MLLDVAHDRQFQAFLDQQENTLYSAIRPPLAHTMRLTLREGSTAARDYLIRRGHRLLVAHYRRIWRDAWRSIDPPNLRRMEFTKQDGAGMSAFLEEQLDWLEAEGGARITGIADNVVADMIDTVMARVAEGKSNDAIARELYAEIPELSQWRAATIARTETHTSALEAISETIEAKGFDTETMEKEWFTADDDRVRPSHRAMHGARIGFNDAIEVDGSLMLRPGDSSLGAGAGLIVNCRCSVLFHTEEESYE